MKIKIISKRRQSALVEFIKNHKLQRVTIPIEDIVDNQVSEYKLKMAIPYGVEWSEVITLKATSQDLEQNLRRIGIWTKEDALQNVNKVLGAIQATYQVDLGAILKIAKGVK